MKFEESALSFPCHDSWLYGILSLPEQPVSRGVLIVVGGPQYRVGSHRQFTLLARDFASHGVPVMRFDYRGIGDSEGAVRTFEEINDDLRCAIDRFFEQIPTLRELVIWGLCDAASAALFYAHQDRRVTGLILLNPWVRTEEGIAKAYLKHYYFSRFFERDLWEKVLGGRFDFVVAGRSFLKLMNNAFLGRKKDVNASPDTSGNGTGDLVALHERMFGGFSHFKGRILLILSGNDLTSQEFSGLVKGSRKWRALLGSSRVKCFDLPGANHTFSRRDWREQVATWSREWVQAW